MLIDWSCSVGFLEKSDFSSICLVGFWLWPMLYSQLSGLRVITIHQSLVILCSILPVWWVTFAGQIVQLTMAIKHGLSLASHWIMLAMSEKIGSVPLKNPYSEIFVSWLKIAFWSQLQRDLTGIWAELHFLFANFKLYCLFPKWNGEMKILWGEYVNTFLVVR